MLDHQARQAEPEPMSMTTALSSSKGPASDRRTADIAARRFRQISAVLIALSSIVLLRLVGNGDVGAGYQGDEGARIFDAYQAAFHYPNALYGGIWESTADTFFGVHPPGDNLVRSTFALALDLVGLHPNPVSVMFTLSIITVGIAHYLATEIALRAGGIPAGAITLFLLLGSFVFNDIKVSSMGEATAIPLLLGGILVVQTVVNDPERRLRYVAVGALLVGLSTFVRPEPSLLLPGLCLALWLLIGFARAALFGAVAGSFEMAKLVHSTFFASEEDLSILNVGSAYYNGSKTIGTLWRSDFIQQLLTEPAVLLFPLGLASSVIFISLVRHRMTSEWRTHLLVFAATISFLAVNIAAQLTGLAPHSSYRVVITSGPTMIIGFSLAFVGLARLALPILAARYGEDPARFVLVGALVLLCGWGAYDFMTAEVSAVTARVPEGVRLSADEVLARSDPSDAIYVDRMRYWENGLLGYFADRDAPVCNYARCSSADSAATTLWEAQRSDEPEPGTTTWGEFNALRMHAFISGFEPAHIVLASESTHNDWTRVASGLWGEEAPLWSSHVLPYLDAEIDYQRPAEQFLRLGSVHGVDYFEEYVYLIPRSSNDVGIVYEAFYGRAPDEAE